MLEGFSIQSAKQVCKDLHKLNCIVQSLCNKLGATVVIPQLEQWILKHLIMKKSCPHLFFFQRDSLYLLFF